MANQFPLASMLVQMRNAMMVHRGSIEMRPRPSKFCREVLAVLQQEGFVTRFYEVPGMPRSAFRGMSGKKWRSKWQWPGTVIEFPSARDQAFLRQNQRFTYPKFEIVSKRRDRKYVKNKELKKMTDRERNWIFGSQVLSTSEGVMTAKEAYHRGVGGEILFNVRI